MSVDDFQGLAQPSPISSYTFKNPVRTLHTLHQASQTLNHQVDKCVGFALKTLHPTLHQPYTRCFAKFADITGPYLLGAVGDN